MGAASPPTVGATFTVKLPLTIADTGASPATRTHPTAASLNLPKAAIHLDGVRVLMVDDDPDALDLGATILTGAGADVRTCLSAAEGLEMLPQWAPDVLVSD